MFIKLLRQRGQRTKAYIKRENDGITIKDIIAGCIRVPRLVLLLQTQDREEESEYRDIELTSTNGCG